MKFLAIDSVLYVDSTKGWRIFVNQVFKDIQLLLFICLVLFLFRVILLMLLSNQIANDSDITDVLSVLWMGGRFDLSTAAVWIAPTFLLSLSCLFWTTDLIITKLRHFSASVFVVLSTMLLGFDVVFFKTYGDHYNQMIFGLFDDDTVAILVTIWNEYHPLLTLALLLVIGIILYRKLINWMSIDIHWFFPALGLTQVVWVRGMAFISMLLLLVFFIRGSTVAGSPLLIKHGFITHDLFLNRLVVNPLLALRKTITQRLALVDKAGYKSYWPSDNLHAALQQAGLVTNTVNANTSVNFDQTIVKQAQGHQGAKPQHVFLVLMESYSGWTLLPEYRELGFSPGTSQYLDQGIYFQRFLPATQSTIDSLNVLVTGLPYAGLEVNKATQSSQPYATSVAQTYRRLGYKTRFFYGGYLGWRRLDQFLPAQGFDNIYGAGNLPADAHKNEWGVDDEYLFDFVLQTVANNEAPSFNFILTTSNHSSYDLDLPAKGYPFKVFPQSITALQADALTVIGHHWYADREFGRFIESVQTHINQPLIAMTGDHPARLRLKFPGDNHLEQRIVPFFLYGPEVLLTTSHPMIAGSHVDIIPTLIELSANAGFNYAAVGKSLLHKGPTDVGVAEHFVITMDGMADLTQPEQLLAGRFLDKTFNNLSELTTQFNALRALSWYRVRNGPVIHR